MPPSSTSVRYFSIYLLKFLGAFCVVYYGTKAMIGLSVQGGYYIAFIDHYLDYISVLRKSLLYGAKGMLRLFGENAGVENAYSIRLENGRSVRMVYACLGYGIISFWLAFVFANKGSFKKKLAWMAIGFIAIWFINVARFSLLLVAINKHSALPFNLNHHLLFNIVAYVFIFILIILFDRSDRGRTTLVADKG